MSATEQIIATIAAAFPYTQAIYLFGSYGTEHEWPDSDVDIAVLLPPDEAKALDDFALLRAQTELQNLLCKPVDLLNLRRLSTVFQKEVIMAERRIYTADVYAADEFEMLTLSMYQKLNEERAGILAEGLRSGRFYKV